MSPHSDDDDFPAKEEDEVSIPRASLNKFVKEVLPDARLTTETRDLLLNCCHCFIHKLATEANIACSKANKKTISPQHILEGLDAMNLSSYKEHAEVACQEAKEEIKGRKMLSASYRFKHQDSEELERLAKEQQEIFEQFHDIRYLMWRRFVAQVDDHMWRNSNTSLLPEVYANDVQKNDEISTTKPSSSENKIVPVKGILKSAQPNYMKSTRKQMTVWYKVVARADFIGERLDREDLLAASNCAASDLSNYMTGHGSSQSSNYPDANSGDINTATESSTLPTATGSGRILGSSVIGDDDNYDE